jgi:hypothetical protein
MAEQRIAAIGAETRAAIEEAAERRRRDGLTRPEHDGPLAEVPRVRQVH